MKLISLNTWGGKHFDGLINFTKQNQDTDIFCFQEIYDTSSSIKQFKKIRSNLLWELSNILINFNIFFFPTLFNTEVDETPTRVDFDLKHGSAIFIKKTISTVNQKNYFISKDMTKEVLKDDLSNLTTSLQSIAFNGITVLNYHGTAMPGSKLDTPQRFEETKKVIEMLNQTTGAKILVGDFNLLPQTECIGEFEKILRNLIKEFNIPRTRSKLSPYFGKEDFQKFADYTFVSEEINVKNFKVLDISISDHLPMILEFS